MPPAQMPHVPDDAPFTPQQRVWLDGFLAGFYTRASMEAAGAGPVAKGATTTKAVAYTKENPFPAPLLVNRVLTGKGSDKDTRHFEIGLEGSGLSYEVGDALGVQPTNWPEYVEDLLKVLGCKGDEMAPVPKGGSAPLREAFLAHYDITKPPRSLIEAVAEKSGDSNLKRMLTPEGSADLDKYLWGREIIDLPREFPKAKFSAEEFVRLLKKLAPRLYSIASSLKAHPNEVHLTVAVVRYESHGRKREGVCSSCLAERVPSKSTMPIFMHHNKNFRPPVDGNRPIIMVGPGTGIAPFRAFLEERKAVGAKGKNWLFFGDQHAATDFLYGDEFQAMLKESTLAKLDLAFSRDQAQKVYVQNRILENAAEFYKWLQEGAHMYVCGDASRMAKDVDQALHQVVQKAGGLSVEDAAAYVQKMKSEKRYQRDVY